MKQKKAHSQRVVQRILPQAKQSSQTKTTAFSKKRQQRSNKQNIIQITQPLDPNMQTCTSKEFTHSRDNINRNYRPTLQDIQLTTNLYGQDYTQKIQQQPQYHHQTDVFDRRLSLKCLHSHSQQFQAQKSQRLSMLPPRRESITATTTIPVSLMQERDSICSSYQPTIHSQQSRSDMHREVIITNLVSKLQHEEDLRSIIQSKLRNNSQQLYRQRKNQSYLTDFTEDNTGNSQSMVNKLKQYENQIKYFKGIVREMSEKITQTNSQRGNCQKQRKQINEYQEKQTLTAELLSIFKEMGKCCCHQPKITQNVSTQTTQIQVTQQTKGESLDFMDNLEKTLKVLSEKH